MNPCPYYSAKTCGPVCCPSTYRNQCEIARALDGKRLPFYTRPPRAKTALLPHVFYDNGKAYKLQVGLDLLHRKKWIHIPELDAVKSQ